jgi:hypothetical protein
MALEPYLLDPLVALQAEGLPAPLVLCPKALREFIAGAAFLTSARVAMNASSIFSPEISKFSPALVVKDPYRASAGTYTTPRKTLSSR